MSDDSPKRRPKLQMVTNGRLKPAADGEALLTVKIQLTLRNRLKYVARARNTTSRRLLTRAIEQIIAEFDASSPGSAGRDRDH